MSWRSKGYDDLPALSVRGPELRKSLRIVTMAWMYGIVWMACVSGSHVKIFARMLGFNDFAFGLLGAIPFVATFGQLVASILIERTGLRKFQLIQCNSIHRLLWLAVAAIPLILPIPSRVAVVAMLVILLMSWFMAALGTPAWLAWMGDLVPRRIRGRYFANRSRFSRAIMIPVVVGLGILLDAVVIPGKPETFEAQPVLLMTICLIFVIAAVFGLIDVLLHLRVREVLPSTHDKPREPVIKIDVPTPARWTLLGVCGYVWRYLAAAVHQLLLEPLNDRVFRHYVGYGAVVTFGMSVGGWYFWLNAMENLGFSKLGANCLFLVIGPLAGMTAARGWGRIIDYWGRRPVLILATGGTILSVMPWFFATTNTPAPHFIAAGINWLAGSLGGLFGRGEWVWLTPQTPLGAYLLGMLACIIGGVCWTGIQLAQIGIVLGFSDGHGRSKYIAASAVLISIGGMLGGLTGGVLTQSLRFLQAAPIILGLFVWNNWHAAFALAVLARILAFCWVLNMPDPGARKVRDLVRHVRVNVYNNMATRLFYSLRIFGWGRADRQRGNNKRTRQKRPRRR